MADLSKEQVEAILKGVNDRYLEQNLIESRQVKMIEVKANNVFVKIQQGYPSGNYRDELKQQVTEALLAAEGIDNAEVVVEMKVQAHTVQKTLKRIKGIKNIIAVASGKGGVGKSTTSVNMALALSADGATVGLLDADIYGPSQPRMMGLNGQPESEDGKSLNPMVNYNIATMSIGYLIDEDTPMIWRGPMVTQALEQLLADTLWGDLDYLIVDLPPGTGDTQLTLSQKIPVSGAVIVTTPQDIALLDARKGLKMFEKVEIPVLGVVENMSIHICSQCGNSEHIFGSGGGQKMSKDFDVTYLGALPLDISIRETTDAGKPSVVANPDGKITQMYKEISRKTAAELAHKGKDYSTKFPTIRIETP